MQIKDNRHSVRLISALILTLLVTNAVSKLVTASSGPTVFPLNGTFQAVNNSAGDQTNPDLDCNLTSYANQDIQGLSRIHYQAPPANTDLLIPGNGSDFQPHVNGNRIAFTEDNSQGAGVAVFDVMTQFRTDIPGAKRSNPAIGGDMVAYEDRSFFTGPNQSELGIYDLNSQTDLRLTNDLLFDKNPAVSPTGNAVVWEKCQTDGSGCNVYSAIQTAPGVFTTTALTTSALGENRSPVTNGQIAVYISDRTGQNDIYYQPLAGGPETRIAIPLDQRDVSISGNLISFASQPENQTEYDIFVYDLSTATLYQVTNTPVDETNIRMTYCNGVGRIVYVSPGVDWDVYSFTFQLPSAPPPPPPPPSPADQINALIALVQSYNLSPPVESTLVTKLQDALAAVNAGNTASACSSMTSFISKVQSLSDKKITPEQKSQLTTSANQIKANLGCP